MINSRWLIGNKPVKYPAQKSSQAEFPPVQKSVNHEISAYARILYFYSLDLNKLNCYFLRNILYVCSVKNFAVLTKNIFPQEKIVGRVIDQFKI